MKRKVDGKERHIKSAVRFFVPANNGDSGWPSAFIYDLALHVWT